VDGTAYCAKQTFIWEEGSSHTISVGTIQGTGETRYVFNNWSDGGNSSHSIVMGANATTYTANFTTQYQLTSSVSPLSGGSINISPASADGYYARGKTVRLSATANNQYAFSGWSGGLMGTTNPQELVMSAPRHVTATFRLAGRSPSRLPPRDSSRALMKRSKTRPGR
jgi:hypothetical protein